MKWSEFENVSTVVTLWLYFLPKEVNKFQPLININNRSRVDVRRQRDESQVISHSIGGRSSLGLAGAK
jgi:hypothetical protein